MPRALKSEKFFICNARKKGRQLLGVNEERDNLTVQDLIDFLKEKKIDASRVSIPRCFMTSFPKG